MPDRLGQSVGTYTVYYWCTRVCVYEMLDLLNGNVEGGFCVDYALGSESGRAGSRRYAWTRC